MSAPQVRELTELQLDEIAHLREPFSSGLARGSAGHLDYHALRGPGLERLCFHLLLAEGRSPRYFGASGQAQLGVDLIVSEGVGTAVYQCKNLASFSRAQFAEVFDLFEREWLTGRPDLPRPARFVLCCPLDLRDRTANEDWEKLRADFARDHGVAVEVWHRDLFDARLRGLPDIVADLFSDRAAEAFCALDEWNEDLFRPVRGDAGEHGTVGRYLELAAAGRLVRDEEQSARCEEILSTHQLLVLLGPSGSGKTFAALDLATTLDGGAWRTFFLSLRHQTSEDHLVTGIRRRAVRPTVFVLDDCHLDFDLLDRVLDRIGSLLANRPVRLIVTAQALPTEPGALRGSVVELIERCEEAEQVVWLEPSLAQYRAIVHRAASALGDLSPQRLQRLYAATAHDLFLLDAVLAEIQEPSEIDSLGEEALFRLALRRYFQAETVSAPALRQLAAVAQFDLTVPQDSLPAPQPHEAVALRRLAQVTGRPPGLAFVHASAAELLYRALCWAGAEPSWVEPARRHLVALFCSAHAAGRPWERDLYLFLRGRLRLAADLPLKQAVLSDPEMLALFARHRDSLPYPALSLMAFLARGVPGELPFTIWLAERIGRLVENLNSGENEPLALLGRALRTLRLAGGDVQVELEQRIGPAGMLALLAARGTVPALLGVLQYSTPEFAEQMLSRVEPAILTVLIDRTIEQGLSIGTLNLALRDLARRPLPGDPARSQLHAFEERMGAENMLRLIASRGSLGELLRIVQYSTPGFAQQLLTGITQEVIEILVCRAIRLIANRGSLVELLRILKHSTPGFAQQLLTGITPEAIEVLVRRTIEQGRSIGTLALALRDLAQRPLPGDSGRSQLHAFEERMGAESMLRLIASRGSLVELLKILSGSTPGFAQQLLTGITPEAIDVLARRTIEQGRSIGTLHLALRDLAQNPLPGDPVRSQLYAFEERMGAENMLRLIASRGSLSELLKILEYSTPGFVPQLLTGITPEMIEVLVRRTIEQGRSIVTLTFALRSLALRPWDTDPSRSQRDVLEAAFDGATWWRLVLGAGDLNHLAYLLEALSSRARQDLLAPHVAPGPTGWDALIRQGTFYDLCRFARDSLAFLEGPTRRHFLEAAGGTALGAALARSDWIALASGAAALADVREPTLQAGLQAALAAFLDGVEVEGLQFAGFSHSVSGIALLWRERRALRPTLAVRLWSLLPPEREWPDDDRFLVSARYLLALARSAELPDADAVRLLRAFSPLPEQTAVEDTPPRPAFLFLWNLYALWFQRGRREALRFADLQPPRVWERFLAALHAHVEKRLSNEERLDLLGLAGALAYLVPEFRTAVQAALRGRIRGVHDLREQIDGLTFVSAFLILQGLNLVSPPAQNFTPERCALLRHKAETYDERGPAIGHLVTEVRKLANEGRLRRGPVRPSRRSWR